MSATPRSDTTPLHPAPRPAQPPAPRQATETPPVDRMALRYDRPVTFYVWSTVLTWLCWLAAAWLSHQPDQSPGLRVATAALGLVGLAAPLGVVAWLVRDRPALRADIRSRLLWPRGIQRRYLVAAVVLLPASLMLAQAISLLFGYSPEQFGLRDAWSFSSGLLPVWVILGLAPIVEEVAWHSYGTDTLLTRMRLVSACLVFTVFWAVWHLPLALIKGYYQAELVEEGAWVALNFPVSMIAFVILMNWLYFRTGRSIAVAVIFHFVANYANEIFRTEPDVKLIQTAILLAVTVLVLRGERRLFFARPARVGGGEVAA